jgi:hypothetical protein
MARLLVFARFKDQASPPEGDPPRFTVHGESEEIRVLEGDRSLLSGQASFDTDVTTTGETSFDERGVMRFGDGGDSIRFTTVGEGTLTPSAEEGLHEGSVIWRVEDGEGRFRGASGLITSNFMLRMESGEVQESQVIALSVP